MSVFGRAPSWNAVGVLVGVGLGLVAGMALGRFELGLALGVALAAVLGAGSTARYAGRPVPVVWARWFRPAAWVVASVAVVGALLFIVAA